MTKKKPKKEKPERQATSLELRQHFVRKIAEISGMELALVSGVVVEELLSRLLEHVLLSYSDEMTFFHKIKMAYSVGLMPEREIECLDVVRKIRNKFAHGFMFLSFDSPTINNLLSRSAVVDTVHLLHLQQKEEPQLDNEEIFRVISRSLVIAMELNRMSAKKFEVPEDPLTRRTDALGRTRYIAKRDE